MNDSPRHAVGSKGGSFRQTRALILSDLYRYAGNVRLGSFLKHYFFTPGFKNSAVMRLWGYLRKGRLRRWVLLPPF